MGQLVDLRGFCAQCGSKAQPADRFCRSCGHAFGQVGSPTPEPDDPSRGPEDPSREDRRVARWAAWIPALRFSSWLILAFNVLMAMGMLSLAAKPCEGLGGSNLDACQAGMAIGAGLSLFLWAAIDVVLIVVWTVTRREGRPAPGTASRLLGLGVLLLAIASGLGALANAQSEEGVIPADSIADPVIIEATTIDSVWLGKYSLLVKYRIDDLETSADCGALQSEFDQAFDNDSITRASHGTGSQTLMLYIEDALTRGGCHGSGQIQAEGWCNRMRLGLDPAALWLEIGQEHGGVESFVIRARSWMINNCPEQLIDNEFVKVWMDNCGPPEKTGDCEDWSA